MALFELLKFLGKLAFGKIWAPPPPWKIGKIWMPPSDKWRNMGTPLKCLHPSPQYFFLNGSLVQIICKLEYLANGVECVMPIPARLLVLYDHTVYVVEMF